MKKKNLLNLGALALSLGLVVTSCAGANGQDGKDGENGKTYIPIIVNSWLFEDVDVTQSAYFVEPGEEVTFKAASGKTQGEVLTSLKFNGVEFLTGVEEADNNGKATWILTTASTDKGFQMTDVGFGTAKSYALGLIDSHLEAISESDHAIYSAGISTDGHKHDAVNAAYVNYEDKDSSLWGTTRPLAYAKVEEVTVTSLMTMAQKIEAYKAAANEGNTLIDTAYELVVNNAKEAAKKEINGLKDTTKGLKAADWANDKASAVSAVEAAKTLEDVCKVIQETAHVATTTTSAIAQGSFYALKGAKDSVLGTLNSALASATSQDDWMNPGNDADLKKELASMKEKLAQYGVEVSSLPSEVYTTWAAQASAAKTFEYNSTKKDYQMAIDGKEAILGSYTNIKKELAAAIQKTYEDEVNNSTALKDMAATRSSLIATIETAVSNFVTGDKDLTTVSVESYLDETSNSGLIYQIEAALTKAVANGKVDAFANERLQNAVSSAKSQLLAKAKSYRTSDSLYGEVFGEAYFKSGNSTNVPDGFKSVKVIITDGEEGTTNKIDNSYINATEVEANSGAYTLQEGASGHNLSTEAVAYDKIALLAGGTDSYDTVQEVKAGLSSALDAVDDAYTNAVADLYSKAKTSTEFGGYTLTANDYTGIEADTIKDAFEDLEEDLTSFDAISKAALASLSAGSQVKKLSDAVSKYLSETVKKSDSAYVYKNSSNKGFFLSNVNSSWKKSFDELVKGLVAGTKSSSDVDTFITSANLKAAYDADVSNWLGKVKENLEQKYVAAQSRSNTVAGQQLTARYNAYVALIGNKADVVDPESDYECGFIKSTSGAYDFRGTSITSCNLIEDFFNSAVLHENSVDSVLVKAEKDYITSKGLDTSKELGKALLDLTSSKQKISFNNATAADTAGKDVKSVVAATGISTEGATLTGDKVREDAQGSLIVDFSKSSNLNLFKSLVDAVAANGGTSIAWANVYVDVTSSFVNNAATYKVTGFESKVKGYVNSCTWTNEDETKASQLATAKSTLLGYAGKKVWVELDGLTANKATNKIVKIWETELTESTVAEGHSFFVLDLTSDGAFNTWKGIVDKVVNAYGVITNVVPNVDSTDHNA